MTEISFYHLTTTPLERTLAKLLEKILQKGHRVVVRVGEAERVEPLATALWTYSPGSFLPHGTARDGFADRQPIWLTADSTENPNNADIIVLVDRADPIDYQSYARCLYLFDGEDSEAIEQARQHYKTHKAAGDALTYWQQGEHGEWIHENSPSEII